MMRELEQSEEWLEVSSAVMATEAGRAMLSMLVSIVHPLDCPFDNPQPERFAGRQEVIAAIWRGQERILQSPEPRPKK